MVFALIGCDGAASELDLDAGVDATETSDAALPLACSNVRQITGVAGETVSVMFDTALVETRPRDLGLNCGNREAELRWAPQEVVELLVPGGPDATYAVEFTTNLPGTQMDFNTVIQVRDTCESVPTSTFPPRCFDDVAMGEYRSRGAVTTPGGARLFFIVTGYSEPPADQMTVDRGTVEVGFTVREGEPPTVEGGYFRLANDDVRFELHGTDPNADVRGVGINFYGPAGELLDLFGDGSASEDQDVVVLRFDDPLALGIQWTGGAWVRAAELNLGPYLRGVGASAARFRVFDAAWGISDPLMVPIEEATLVGLGESCDGETFCRTGMVCSTGVCIPTAQLGALCDGAVDVIVPATSVMGATVTQLGRTGAGEGQISIPVDCVAGDVNAGIGAEAVYKIDVPLEAFDLVISTDRPGTEMTDTVLYVRGECPDSGTLLACNDDIARGVTSSRIELTDQTAGTYYAFVESYRGLASGTAPHELSVEVRPIIESGLACDPETTRCATGACTEGVCP